jgi:hypothetical protein
MARVGLHVSEAYRLLPPTLKQYQTRYSLDSPLAFPRRALLYRRLLAHHSAPVADMRRSAPTLIERRYKRSGSGCF